MTLKQILPTVILTASISFTGAGLMMWQNSAVATEKIQTLERTVESHRVAMENSNDKQEVVNRIVQKDMNLVYELSGNIQQLTSEVKGLREDIRSLRK